MLLLTVTLTISVGDDALVASDVARLLQLHRTLHPAILHPRHAARFSAAEDIDAMPAGVADSITASAEGATAADVAVSGAITSAAARQPQLSAGITVAMAKTEMGGATATGGSNDVAVTTGVGSLAAHRGKTLKAGKVASTPDVMTAGSTVGSTTGRHEGAATSALDGVKAGSSSQVTAGNAAGSFNISTFVNTQSGAPASPGAAVTASMHGSVMTAGSDRVTAGSNSMTAGTEGAEPPSIGRAHSDNMEVAMQLCHDVLDRLTDYSASSQAANSSREAVTGASCHISDSSATLTATANLHLAALHLQQRHAAQAVRYAEAARASRKSRPQIESTPCQQKAISMTDTLYSLACVSGSMSDIASNALKALRCGFGEGFKEA